MSASPGGRDVVQSPDPLSLFRLDGRVAIVTRASSGLGERFARVLHAAGASVVVTARRRDRLDRLAAALPGALAVAADVSDPDDRERIVATTVDHFGGVGILVNNAGVSEVVGVEDESLEDPTGGDRPKDGRFRAGRRPG